MLSAAGVSFASGADFTCRVLPLMGSDSTYAFSTGNTYPAVGRPNGMHLWTLQTGKNGSGWIYGCRDAVGEEDRASWFTHKAEIVEPQRLKVHLADDEDKVSENVRT